VDDASASLFATRTNLATVSEGISHDETPLTSILYSPRSLGLLDVNI
jgi:hypothetical protein